jgi:hypothetical protein
MDDILWTFILPIDGDFQFNGAHTVYQKINELHWHTVSETWFPKQALTVGVLKVLYPSSPDLKLVPRELPRSRRGAAAELPASGAPCPGAAAKHEWNLAKYLQNLSKNIKHMFRNI